MIVAYDSTNLADIPTTAQMLLYYLNGSWPASSADLARFPSALKESISVTPFANVGDWLDVETGDAFPWQAPDWVVMRRNAGHPNPGVYVEYGKWAATRNEFISRGIPEPRWWIALWDGQAILLDGADGKQYAADHPGTIYASGGHFDKSVFNYVFGGGTGQAMALDPNDPVVQKILHVYQVIGEDYYAQKITGGDTDPTQAHSLVLDGLTTISNAIKTELDVIQSASTPEKLQAAVTAAIAKALADYHPEPNSTVPSLWDVLKVTFGK